MRLTWFWSGVVTGWFMGAGLARGPVMITTPAPRPRVPDRIGYRRSDGSYDYVSLNGDD